MKPALILFSALAIASTGAMSHTSSKAGTAKKATATQTAARKKAAAKKPAARKTTTTRKAAPARKPAQPAAQSPLRERLAVNPITGASAPAAPLPPGPGVAFPAAGLPVFAGAMRCDMNQTVTVTPDAADPYLYTVQLSRGPTYAMRQVPTTTGVVRLEDKQAGATWMQLGNKSMLMNQKLGQRMADGCRNEVQAAREEELKLNPVDLLK